MEAVMKEKIFLKAMIAFFFCEILSVIVLQTPFFYELFFPRYPLYFYIVGAMLVPMSLGIARLCGLTPPLIGIQPNVTVKDIKAWLRLSAFLFLLLIAVTVGVTSILGLMNPRGYFEASMSSFYPLAFILPITEEIIYRGFLFLILDRFFRRPIVIFISSLLFTLAHFWFKDFSFISFLMFFFFGTILGYVYHRTENLLVTILWHLSINAFVLFLFSHNELMNSLLRLFTF